MPSRRLWRCLTLGQRCSLSQSRCLRQPCVDSWSSRRSRIYGRSSRSTREKGAPKTEVGLAVFYVDDILIAAEPEARDGFLRSLGSARLLNMWMLRPGPGFAVLSWNTTRRKASWRSGRFPTSRICSRDMKWQGKERHPWLSRRAWSGDPGRGHTAPWNSGCTGLISNPVEVAHLVRCGIHGRRSDVTKEYFPWRGRCCWRSTQTFPSPPTPEGQCKPPWRATVANLSSGSQRGKAV